MPVKPVLTGIMLIFVVFLLVYMVEFFIPLSVKADIDMICRNALLSMENAGGMTSDKKRELKAELESRGLTGVVITATENAKQGGQLTLRVEGDYTYNRITSLFGRGDVTLRMVYDKSTMSRKVVN
ncbi:MAG: hypothetical protein WAP56_08595 [Acetivibrionales bacterium]|jgi:hypothetical protein|nr:hypothetical protein [Bacillota bacterium]NLP08321.1 hypothetical protein [Clostridiaceae bacterium]HOA55333.1 hypothetical protein [Clostridiales bacterium]HPZ04867.1 hypothetical protein [Clostridiales bacterium]HQD31758.1 hypothetical protein [Clostridiales bacterium]